LRRWSVSRRSPREDDETYPVGTGVFSRRHTSGGASRPRLNPRS
jgi:hypothetical protein